MRVVAPDRSSILLLGRLVALVFGLFVFGLFFFAALMVSRQSVCHRFGIDSRREVKSVRPYLSSS
jgi:hypothetical protein